MNPPMKFETKIVALQRREWSEYYLDYNGLKRILAEIDNDNAKTKNNNNDDVNHHHYQEEENQISLLTKTSFNDEHGTTTKFLAELYRQVQKITLFVLKQQGKLADELMECQNEHQMLKRERDDYVEGDANAVVPASSKSSLRESQFRALMDKFNRIGAELLHLLQFVDLNQKGVVRILKKHDKRVTKLRAYDVFLLGESRSAATVAPLFRTESLDALAVNLQDLYANLRKLQGTLFVPATAAAALNAGSASTTASSLSLTSSSKPVLLQQDLERGRSRIGAAAPKPRTRSPKSLGRRFKSIQGLDMLGDDAQYLADLAMYNNINSSSNGAADDANHHSSETNKSLLAWDDFIVAQIYAARRNLKQQNEVLNMLAGTALSFPEEPPDISMPGQESDIKAEYERASALADYNRKSAFSRVLNLVSSFIYMTNYLIVVPTVVTYSNKLGANPSLSSAIVGMTPFATIFSTFLYSWWTSYSYRTPLLFASVLNVAGNIIYALGYPCDSMAFVLMGRLLSGMGSCRPINRRYIADAYSTADRTAASAHFVAVGTFGMALGPFIGSVLHRIAENSASPYWQVENAPGWFMAMVWFVYSVFHVLFFVDPPKDDHMDEHRNKCGTGTAEETKPLLLSTQKLLDVETRVPIWRNAAVMVNFFIYFIEKLLMECVSSSTSILTYYYFSWPGSWAGYYLAFLCLLVLPVNVLVAILSKTYEDRQMMIFMQIFTVIGCLVILRYGETYYLDQYLFGTLIIVVFSNMVEGPNMSLLSKVIPKSWRKGFLNVGLLATEAATLGRTFGDAYLALCGAGGLENQLNYTFGSMVVATSFTLWISWHFYDSLVPTEDKTL